MNIGERLTQKLGPLPVWMWGLLVAGIALLAYLFMQRSPAPVAGGTNLDAVGYQTSGLSGPVDNNTVDALTPDNNLAWLNRASRGVADILGVSPSAVNAALYKYLSGQEITSQEQGWVDQAINRFMSPPEGTQGVSTVIPDAAPTPAPEPKPNSSKGYTARIVTKQGKSGQYHAVYGNTWGIELWRDGKRTWLPYYSPTSAAKAALRYGVIYKKVSEAEFKRLSGGA